MTDEGGASPARIRWRLDAQWSSFALLAGVGVPGAFVSVAVDGSGWIAGHHAAPLLVGGCAAPLLDQQDAWHWVEITSDGRKLTCRVDGRPAHFERGAGDTWTIQPGAAGAAPLPCSGDTCDVKRRRAPRRRRSKRPAP